MTKESENIINEESADNMEAVSTDISQPEEQIVKIKNTMHDIEKMLLEEQNNNNKFPNFRVGDTIKVSVRIKEGTKERIQIYEGVVICFKHGMNRKTFMVRRVTAGISIERVFSFHSPYLASIEIVRKAKVRRAKLYFLRGRFGKAARLKELALKKGENKLIK